MSSTEQLSETDAVIVSTILEDFLDQLVIMGRILPASLEHRANAEEIVKGEIGNVITNQMFLQVCWILFPAETLFFCRELWPIF